MSLTDTVNTAHRQAELDKETDKLVQAYSAADLEKQRSISLRLRKDLFGAGAPRNAEELYKYLQCVYGIRLGTTVSDEQWTPPFEWAHAMYFDTYPTLLTIAARGTGKTLSASAITYDKCAHRTGYAAVHLGSRLDQADVAQGYLFNYSQDEAVNVGLDRRGIGKKRANWTSTGANWKIVSGTLAGVSGQHPQMLSLDELEFAEATMVEQSWAVPMEKNGWPRLWTGFSTRQRASSVMSQLTQDAESGKRKIKLMQWSIFEAMQPCKTCLSLDAHPHGGTEGVEEARQAVCPLWKYCHGVKAKKVSGWMTLQQVVDTMSTMNEDSIETQMLCLRPTSHGQVLHNFKHEHADSANRNRGNYFPWKYQKDLPFFVWIDPAETKKGCALFVQVYKGNILAFDEIIDESGPTTDAMKEAVHKKCIENGYGEPKRVVIDPRRTDTKKTWNSGTLEGIGRDHYFNAVFPNIKNGMDDIEAGLDLVRTYTLNGVGERRFFINPETCPKTVTAIRDNMYKVDKNNEIHQNTKQSEKFKDEIDMIRYGIIDMHRSGGSANV